VPESSLGVVEKLSCQGFECWRYVSHTEKDIPVHWPP
jgi:hypothetical protein